MSALLSLIIRSAEGAVRQHTMQPGNYTLGREADCDVVIESSDVSRHHARLILTDRDFQIVDLGSTLGTKVNGQPLSGPKRVNYPAMLQLGSVNITLKPASGEGDLPLELDTTAPPAADPDAQVPYVFGEQIARGGMGSILEADDCKLGRKVAVKIMLSELEADDYQKARFAHEAAVLARLAHPNIVPVYDIGRDAEGQLYYSMKLVKGRTLQAILNNLRDGEESNENKESGRGILPLSPAGEKTKPPAPHYTLDRLLTIFRKVCDAMAFAHSRAIIHRDLKPENIMVGEFGEVLVMDWGLAKFLNDPIEEVLRKSIPDSPASIENFGMTMEGDVMGTPQYMSPEQAEGRINELDARSDIYSLGGILYTILTLRPPIEGTTLEEVLKKVTTGSITPITTVGRARRLPSSQEPSSIRPLSAPIPAALAAVTMKALSVKRERRYPTVAALSADVEAYQGGFATTAENAGASRQLVLLMKRHKGMTASLLVLLLASLGFVLKVMASERAAQQSLTELRATAPTFYEQAKLLTEQEHFPEALEKIAIALKLNPDKAVFQAQRGNTLQSMEQFSEAADAYAAALNMNLHEPHAAENVTLSHALAAAKEKNGALSVNSRTHWRDALLTQGRAEEAIFAGRALASDARKMLPAWQAKLDAWLGKDAPHPSFDKAGGYDLNLSNRSLTDLSPLRGMPLHNLTISGNPHLKDLRPLADCTLEALFAVRLPELVDLSPLKGKDLHYIELVDDSALCDLRPLAGMPLDTVTLTNTGVSDLTPLHGTMLKRLDLSGCPLLRSLDGLQGQPLESVHLASTHIASLDPIGEAPLTFLDISGASHLDLASLRQHQLRALNASNTTLDHLELLADMSGLEIVIPPLNFADPGLLHKLPHLRKIDVNYTGQPFEQLKDAADFFRQYDAPSAHAVRTALVTAGLRNLPLKSIEIDPTGRLRVDLSHTLITDLTPLHGLPIKELNLIDTAVSDLAPLRGMPLDTLLIVHTNVSSLEPLRGAPLVRLHVGGSKVSDVGALADCADLEEVCVSSLPKNVDRLRSLKKLRFLSANWDAVAHRPAQTTEQFWQEYDAHQTAPTK